MRTTKDISNNRYGRLTAIERVANDKYGHSQWLCRCDCGNQIVVLKSSLESGRTRSCGCYYGETRRTCATTHGQSSTRLFHIWANIIDRCRNSKRKDWNYYGGKGVRVCEEWKTFEKFAEWAHKSGYKEDLTIDRIDTNGNYEPMNCRWVNRFAQMNNTTRNHLIECNGETHTIAEWSRINGTPLSTIFYRLKRGYSEQEAISVGCSRG